MVNAGTYDTDTKGTILIALCKGTYILDTTMLGSASGLRLTYKELIR